MLGVTIPGNAFQKQKKIENKNVTVIIVTSRMLPLSNLPNLKIHVDYFLSLVKYTYYTKIL